MENYDLKTCFEAIEDNKQGILNIDFLRHTLVNQFKIKLNCLDANLSDALPHLLVYHLNHWSGWKRSPAYFRGYLPFQRWYEDLISFLTQKLEEAINVHYKEIAVEPLEPRMIHKDANSQTEVIRKDEAPFYIRISGNAELLNKIIFTDDDKNILLKHHELENWSQIDMKAISLKQILSWPHVGIEFISPVLHISRRNKFEYQRYISFVPEIPSVDSVDFIKSVDIVKAMPKQRRVCYTIDYMQELLTEFVTTCRSKSKDLGALAVMQVLFGEFLTDIKDIHLRKKGKPSMASYTSVLFNMGRGVYLRNKKVTRGNKEMKSSQDIGYFEIIIPRMETALINMGTEEEIESYLGNFECLTATESHNSPDIPRIKLSCDFCQEHFEKVQFLLFHMEQQHKMEPPVMCLACRQKFSVLDLSQIRWKHECNGSK